MWTSFVILAVLPLVPGQAGELALTNVRHTYGLRGPTRSDARLLPGDTLFLAFDVEGAKVDTDGKAKGSIALEVLDDKGKVQLRQAPREVAVEVPTTVKSLPAYAHIQIGLDQPPGEYTLRLTATDHVAQVTRQWSGAFQVLPKGFGIVGVALTADSHGTTPATNLFPGRSFWINCALVGFGRDEGKQQPHINMALRAQDERGQAALPKPPAGEVGSEVPRGAQTIPMQFVLRLHQAGKYSIQLKAEDKVTGKDATVEVPIVISPPPAVASHVTDKGLLLRRVEGQKSWDAVDQKGTLAAGDLLVGLPGAMVDSADGAVRLTLDSDFDGKSPYPVIESAVQLRVNPAVDLDFTLDRGRVTLLNRKPVGPARVQVHVRQESWNLTLAEPGTSITLVLSGRWPPGIMFTSTPGPNDVPTADLEFLVLHGNVNLEHDGAIHALTAPPGPALVEWDSVHGQDDAPQRLDKLPAWASQGNDEKSKATIQRLREALATKPSGPALMEFVSSDNPEDRRTAVFLLAALDDGERITRVVRGVKDPDVLEAAILALRNWIGRGPGQDLRLYHGLIEQEKVPPARAAALLYYLHTPGPAQLARPEIYQALVGYLDHKEPFVRGLAYWHLYRLVPAGREFGYNPLTSKEAREPAVEKWKQLVAKWPLRDQQKAGTHSQ
jgi:hypothetical protein